MYQRSHVQTVLGRLSEPPRLLLIVSGPRQSGKTTLVRQALAGQDRPYRYVAVDEPTPASAPSPQLHDFTLAVKVTAGRDQRNLHWLVEQWEIARNKAIRSPNGYVLVLDEIQKIERWSETVKGLWDADRAAECDLHIILLGSSPLLVQAGLTESLAGRFELVPVQHWSFLEMYEAFDLDLDSFLYFGGYPGSIPMIRNESRWRDYLRTGLIEPNIEKDILMMVRVHKPALLRQLLYLGCDYSGQILSFNKMLGALHDAGNTTTLAHYLHLLSGIGLLAGLPKFGRRPHQVRGSSPKLNVLNTALMTVASNYSFAQARVDRTFWGRLVVSAVGAHLCNTRSLDLRLFYWREGAYEVDFVLEQAGKTVAIEVTVGRSARHRRGLEEFRKRFGPEATGLVGMNDGAVPVEEFLSVPAGHWFREP